MKRINIYILLSIFLFAFWGCEDLDTLPESETVTTAQKEDIYTLDPEKAEAEVNAIFAKFNQYQPNSTTVGDVDNDYGFSSIMLFTDHNGYDLVASDVGYNWNSNDLDFSDRLYTSYISEIVWNDMYSIIYATNNVISSIDPKTEDATSQFYLAQGLATRAYSYWVLAQLYQFNYVGHESDLCVPIVTNLSSDSLAIIGGGARATVQEVYGQIKSDIDAAITLLTSAQKGNITRADKRYISLAVAYGIRARMNLTMQNWSTAAADADSAITISSATPASISDVSVPYFWDASESNWMWGIIISETDDVVASQIINWISHMGSFNYGYCTVNNGKQINKALYNSIASSDVRKGWWIDENLVSTNLTDDQAAYIAGMGFPAYTQVKFAPYNNELGTTTNANDIPLMRIEEMYLIKAEAEAMSGGDGKSTLESFVQTYRDQEYKCDATSASDIQEEVFRQRRIELWGEGLNWFDVMRLNKNVDRRGGGYPDETMVLNIMAGDNILLWRIPEAEIQSNNNISEEDNNPPAPRPEPVTDFD